MTSHDLPFRAALVVVYVLLLPDWARWGGAILGALALLLIGWSLRALGSNFVATLGMRADHAPVTHGPYRFVRHPMYAGLLLLQVAMALASATVLPVRLR